MSVKGIFDCYAKPFEIFDYEMLKDDPLIDLGTIGLKGSPTNIFRSFTPMGKSGGRMLSGDEKSMCSELAALLSARNLI